MSGQARNMSGQIQTEFYMGTRLIPSWAELVGCDYLVFFLDLQIIEFFFLPPPLPQNCNLFSFGNLPGQVKKMSGTCQVKSWTCQFKYHMDADF